MPSLPARAVLASAKLRFLLPGLWGKIGARLWIAQAMNDGAQLGRYCEQTCQQVLETIRSLWITGATASESRRMGPEQASQAVGKVGEAA